MNTFTKIPSVKENRGWLKALLTRKPKTAKIHKCRWCQLPVAKKERFHPECYKQWVI